MEAAGAATTWEEAAMTDILDLAQRATACKGWRWLPGMLVAETDDRRAARLVGIWEEGVCPDTPGGPAWAHWGISASQEDLSCFLPDLDDPATRGALLALVREAWPEETLISLVPRVGALGWEVLSHHALDDSRGLGQPEHVLGEADSEAEALVLALEAAP
jgi:hypothetical protein